MNQELLRRMIARKTLLEVSESGEEKIEKKKFEDGRCPEGIEVVRERRGN